MQITDVFLGRGRKGSSWGPLLERSAVRRSRDGGDGVEGLRWWKLRRALRGNAGELAGQL